LAVRRGEEERRHTILSDDERYRKFGLRHQEQGKNEDPRLPLEAGKTNDLHLVDDYPERKRRKERKFLSKEIETVQSIEKRGDPSMSPVSTKKRKEK